MGEYIKREDALDAVLFALVGTGLQSTAIYALRDVPAADVAPKSEVKETVEKLMSATDKVICEAKQEIAREIFEEIEKIIQYSYYVDELGEWHDETLLLGGIDELKKKYTKQSGE